MKVRVGLCPDRLVVARRKHRWTSNVEGAFYPIGTDPVSTLAALAGKEPMTVVLSSHFVRYYVLPWSKALRSKDDWLAFAQHSFQTTYGPSAVSGWRIRVCGRGRSARVATAVNVALVDALRALPQVISIQPYLMAGFNTRLSTIANADNWFVLQESGRLTVALISSGEWRLARTRRVGADWQAALPALLDRESAALGKGAVNTVYLCSEGAPPTQAAPYRIVDVTLPRSLGEGLRQYAMALH